MFVSQMIVVVVGRQRSGSRCSGGDDILDGGNRCGVYMVSRMIDVGDVGVAGRTSSR